jgi:putative oxidoreductase
MNDSGLVSRWRSSTPYLLSILRIVVAFLFMQVGTAKLFAFPGAVMPGGGTAPIGSLAWIAGFLEAFGGLFLLVGLFTRPVAFVLSGEMAVAYFYGHAPQGLWPVLNQGAPVSLSVPLRRGTRALEHRRASSSRRGRLTGCALQGVREAHRRTGSCEAVVVVRSGMADEDAPGR